MPLFIVRNNITDMRADAIVNTANPNPVIGTGVDTAIHQAAGPKLLEARRQIGYIARGTSAITPAFDLPAKYIIHTVGPVWTDGESGEAEILRGCYESALKLAAEHGCRSVAFPLLSTGNYGFPKDLALQIAVQTVGGFLMGHADEMDVYLVVFDRNAYQLSEKLFSDVKSYIDEKMVRRLREQEYRFSLPAGRVSEPVIGAEERARAVSYYDMDLAAAPAEASQASAEKTEKTSASAKKMPEKKAPRSLQELLGQVGERFPAALSRLIREKGMKNAQVYTRANLTRQHFSKILNQPGYQPGKEAVLALAIALRLNLDETRDFLARAGFALSESSERDIIVQFFIETENYNIFEVEQVLFQFTGRTLASY